MLDILIKILRSIKGPILSGMQIPAAEREYFLRELAAFTQYGESMIAQIELGSRDAAELLAAFQVLKAVGMDGQQYEFIYYYTLDLDAGYSESILQHAEFFKDNGFDPVKYSGLFEATIFKEASRYEYLKLIVKFANFLRDEGFDSEDQADLIQQVVLSKAVTEENYILAEEKSNLLKSKGFSIEKHPQLFAIIIASSGCVEAEIDLVECLLGLGFDLQYDQHLFRKIFQKTPEKQVVLKQIFQMFYNGYDQPRRFKPLYELVLSQAHLGVAAVRVLKYLQQTGFSPEHHLKTYMVAVVQANHIAMSGFSFKEAMQKLVAANYSVQQHAQLFHRLIKFPAYAHQLAMAYTQLGELSISYERFPALYDAVMYNEQYHPIILEKNLEILKAKGFVLEKHEAVYESVLRYVECPENLEEVLCKLERIDSVDLDICQALIDNIKNRELVYLLYDLFLKLSDGKQPVKAVFLLMIKQASVELQQVFIDFLKIKKLEPEKFARLFSDSFYCVAIRDADFILRIFITLQSAGLKLERYADVYLKLLELVDSYADVSHVTSIMMQLTQYLEQSKNPPRQEELLKLVVHKVSSYRFGPLNKSLATKEFEALIRRVAKYKDRPTEIAIYYDSANGYMLGLPGQKQQVSLNLLLRYANLSHLELDDEIVEDLGEMIAKINEQVGIYDNQYSVSPCLSMLPKALQKAARFYVSARYKQVNAFFRGEELLSYEDDFGKVVENNPLNYLIYFLSGSLLNEAINRLAALADVTIEKKDSPILVRNEWLSEEVVERRLKNIIKTPAATSFTTIKEGLNFFRLHPNVTRTELQLPASSSSLINPEEQEVILAHGEPVRYTRNPQGGLFARIVRSPDVIPENYLVGLALNYANEKYLRKKYRDQDCSLKVNGVTIARPNHGLAHTYRVMLYVEQIAHYFACFANSDGFRVFCQDMSAQTLVWLQLAAVFSITGRESEIAAGQDLERYDQYRQASAKHFSIFIETVLPESLREDELVKERMLHIVRYMGNPHYESSEDKSAPVLNDHELGEERAIRNYLHRILSIAHKLDLPRCYYLEPYHHSLVLLRQHSSESLDSFANFKESAYMRLIRYAIELNKAHGNRLCIDISSNNELFHNKYSYQVPFNEVSASLKRLFEVTETVSKLDLSRIEANQACQRG